MRRGGVLRGRSEIMDILVIFEPIISFYEASPFRPFTTTLNASDTARRVLGYSADFWSGRCACIGDVWWVVPMNKLLVSHAFLIHYQPVRL